MAKVFKHKKTGNLYVCLGEAIDCTNIRDGLPVVVYRSLIDNTKTFVRDKIEFDAKFEATTID